MFTNKKDPLVDAVKSVMNEGNLKRQVEEAVNNHFGVSSRKAIPHEQRARYDAALEEAHKYAMKEEEGSTPRNEKAAKEMSAKEVRKFAKTKEKGLPERVDEAKYKGTGTGSSIFKPHKGDYHVVDAGGRTVMVSNMEKDAHEIAKRFGNGHKVIAADNFAKNMNEQPKNIQKESVETIMEEIRTNLEEQLVDAYESGDAQMFENFVLSLTEERKEILGLNEVFGDYAGDPSILSRASRQTYFNQQRQAAGQRTVSVDRPAPTSRSAPSAAPTSRSAPSAAPAAPAGTAARPTAPTGTAARPAAPAARPTPTGTAARPAAPAASAGTPAAKPTPTPTPTGTAGEREAATRAGADSTFDIPDVQQGGQYVHKKAETPSVNAGGQNVGIRSINPETGQASGIATNSETGEKYVPPSETPKTQSTSSSKGWFGVGGLLSTQKELTPIRESLESFIRNKFIKG